MLSDGTDWVVERIGEKSTWLGVLSILGSLGIVVAPEMQEAIVTLALAVAGVVGVVTKEHGKGRW
jgi:hypothetical protein